MCGVNLPHPDFGHAHFLVGVPLHRLLYGNALDAYGTYAFGAAERSQQSQEMLETLACLNVKARHADLTEEETFIREHLAAVFSTEASVQATPRNLRQRLDAIRQRLREGES